MPNPSPPGHRVFFQPGFTNVTSDAVLAEAWVISGPMWDGGLCSMKMLDCNTDSPGVVYPDPRAPLATPAVACPPRLNSTNATGAANGTNVTAGNATAPAARQPVLRVYYGAQCSLWRPGNAVNCSWDNVKQARALLLASFASSSLLTQCRLRRRLWAAAACPAPGRRNACAVTSPTLHRRASPNSPPARSATWRACRPATLSRN